MKNKGRLRYVTTSRSSSTSSSLPSIERSGACSFADEWVAAHRICSQREQCAGEVHRLAIYRCARGTSAVGGGKPIGQHINRALDGFIGGTALAVGYK